MLIGRRSKPLRATVRTPTLSAVACDAVVKQHEKKHKTEDKQHRLKTNIVTQCSSIPCSTKAREVLGNLCIKDISQGERLIYFLSPIPTKFSHNFQCLLLKESVRQAGST